MTTATAVSPVERFTEETCLLPAIFLDMVAREVYHFYNHHPDASEDFKLELYEMLESEEMLAKVEEISGHAYTASVGFKNAVSGKKVDPRDGYRSFMQHWVAASIKEKFPLQYSLLPRGFSNGAPL